MKIKNFCYFIFLFTLLFYFSSQKSLAYDDKTTHPALTQEIIEFYNLHSDQKITNEQKEWIIEGSILEDTPPRWINHFYDPINKTGWTGAHAGNIPQSIVQMLSFIGLSGEEPLSAVEWVNNLLIQQVYSPYGGNRTWKKALEYYADGNEKEAYKTLGYILHLLEDMSVPDHTRDDTHAQDVSAISGDEGSPYEQYASYFNRNTIKEKDLVNNLKKENKTPIIKNTIEDYLISLAEYSNKYFFSKDTINDPKYPNPKIIREDENFGYGKDENGKEFPLVKVWISKTDKPGIIKTYIIEQTDDKILSSYFDHLSRQAVLYGAGVINLFHKQGEDAIVNKEFPTHLVKYDFSFIKIPGLTTSFSLYAELVKIYNGFQYSIDKIKTVTSNIFNSIKQFGSEVGGTLGDFWNFVSNNQNNNGNIVQIPINNENQNNQNQTQNQQNQSSQNNLAQNNNQSQNQNQQNQTIQGDEEPEEPFIPDQVKTLTQTSTLNKINNQTTTEPLQNKNNENQILQKQCSFETSQKPTYKGLIINEVAWMGTPESSNNEWIELKNISSQTIDISGWQLIDKAEQIKINLSNLKDPKIRPNQFILLERTSDNTLPSIQADLIYQGALSNTNEGLRLFDSNCNLIDEVLANSNWPAGDSPSRKTAERTALLSWQTSQNTGGTPKQENSTLNYTGGGGGGSATNSATNNSSQNTNQSQQTQNILISEVQINPIGQRFIELYNPNDFDIDLTGYYLQRKTKTGDFTSLVSKTNFEGKTIKAKSYFLISKENLPNANIVINLTLTDANTIQLKNSKGDVLDKVGWGEASDCETNCAPNPQVNQSIQRKLENNTLKDTQNNNIDFEITNCPSPGEQLNINCQVQASQDAFLKHTNANNVLISEILFNPEGSDSGKEFIELYNPTPNSIDLKDYSLKIIKTNATSATSLASFNNSEDQTIIPPRGFLLIGFSNYASTSIPADIVRTTSLPNDFSKIILYHNDAIIDEFNYDDFKVQKGIVNEGNSIERLAYDGECRSSQNEGEFLGNGCDNDEATDFEIRQLPKPQNSQSLPEPRNKPEIRELSSQYDLNSQSIKISFKLTKDVKQETSTLIYKLEDKNNSSTASSTSTPTPIILFESEAKDLDKINNLSFNSSTEEFIYNIPIFELNKNYNYEFSIKDKDGFESTSSISQFMPSFIEEGYFFKDPNTQKYYFTIKFRDDYHFWDKNDISDTSSFGYKGIVFFLNQNPINQIISTENGMIIPNSNQVKINYSACSFGPSNVLIFPQNKRSCIKGGGHTTWLGTWAYDFNSLEDNIITVELLIDKALENNDYLTLGFYNSFWGNSADTQFMGFSVSDSKKYYLSSNSHLLPPNKPKIEISFDSSDQKLNILGSTTTDPDSLDENLIYEINYTISTELDPNNWTKINYFPYSIDVVYPNSYTIGLRAKDEFQNISEPDIINWSFPDDYVVIASQNIKETSGNPNAGAVAQVFKAQNSGYVQGIKVYLADYSLYQDYLRWRYNLSVSLYKVDDEQNLDLNNIITEENKIAQSEEINNGNIYAYQFLSFNFPSKPYLEENKKYIWVINLGGGIGNLGGTCKDQNIGGIGFAAFIGSGWSSGCNYAPTNYYFILTGSK